MATFRQIFRIFSTFTSLVLMNRHLLQEVSGEIRNFDRNLQRILLEKEMIKCLSGISNQSTRIEGLYCNRTWDNIMCWPDTAAGTVAVQSCPEYISNFNTEAYAIRQCLPIGQWYSKPNNNKTWTNYTACTATKQVQRVPRLIQEHLPRIIIMSNVGYGLSLVSLVIACFIMLYFRKLRCRRNTIHVNLFLSFILRALLALTKDSMLKEGLAFAADLHITEDGKVEFVDDKSHWECKLFFTIFNYTMLTNYIWVFIEGMYLHILIYISVFAENPKTKWYIISGWVLPVLFVIPWVVLRILESDQHCWNTHLDRRIFWIIRAPCVISVGLNFCLFLNIVRVLFTKLNSQQNLESRNTRYTRLAKSISILIPLFTVHLIFIFQPDEVSGIPEIVLLALEMLLSSFQGLVIAILLCFANYEVKTELARFWRHHTLDHNNSHRGLPFTSLSEYFAKTRHSITEQKMTCIEESNKKFDEYSSKKMRDSVKDQTTSQIPINEDTPLNEPNRDSKCQANGHASFPLHDSVSYSKKI
ncbi:glucagon-like peptide 1 receptor [Octopus bimaculoides]|nr:glucagon-like peptide 1 receptor [Octopus bimaculoides]